MICRDAIELVKRHEGLRLTAYLCAAGVPTIGYGSTKGVTLEDVRQKRRITKTQAESRLIDELQEFEDGVRESCTLEPSESQLGALVCFAYNIGLAGFRGSSVLKAHNRGDFEAAAKGFALWNKATVGGKKQVLPGLVARRADEAALYLRDAAAIRPEHMAQAVEPERPMASSKIMQGSAVTAGASVLAMASEAARSVAEIRESLGDWLPYAIVGALVVAVAASGWIMWERLHQRKRGVA